MFLFDTNIWLERLLDQERSNEVKLCLERIHSEEICLTDFTLHSIGVILEKLNSIDAFTHFVKDLFLDGNVVLVSLAPEEMSYVVKAISRYHLDFDDAYQYVAAKRNSLQLISFDKDFDKTDKGRKDPGDIVK